MSVAVNPKFSRNGLLLYINTANTRSYPGTGSVIYDLSGNNRNFTLFNNTYYTYDSDGLGNIKFTREMPPATENGGYASHTASGNLTALNYLYNDHTTEIVVKINNLNPTLYVSQENTNYLFGYRGFHAGFYHNPTTFYYGIWNNRTGSPTVGYAFQSSAVLNKWVHLATVRTGNTLQFYFNGVLSATSSIVTGNTDVGTSNEIRIAAASDVVSAYSWFSDCQVSVARMYNRALSAQEITQNFESTRYRFNIT